VAAVVKRYAKTPVGAHYGTADWLLQRLTAVVMALYSVGFVGYLLAAPPATYADWKAIFSGPLVRLATMLFVAALLYHAWVGMRDIVMDYVKPAIARLALEALVGGALAFYLMWAASILWGSR
jgi:succinate dehydrogenase / fumarate reductase membrane anchor subunit